MGLFDISLMILIVGGAIWLLYHALWKNKGHCHGCEGGSCNSNNKKKT